MVNIEHMHDIKHAMLLYLIGGQYLAKNGVYHISFECVPAQYQPKYF